MAIESNAQITTYTTSNITTHRRVTRDHYKNESHTRCILMVLLIVHYYYHEGKTDAEHQCAI